MRPTLTVICLLAATCPPIESVAPGSDLELIGPRGSIGPIERVQPIPPVEPPTVDLPVHFVSNRGQWAEPVAMAALGGSAMTWLFDDGFAQRFERWAADDGRTGARSCAGAVVRTRFLGAAGTVHGEGRRCSSFHFLHGGDSITDRGFERARIRELLPGIDLVMRPQGQQKSELAYDLYLQPGVDLAGITAECEGAASLSIAADGALCIAVPLPAGESVTLRQSPPVAWQPTALGNQTVDV